MSVLRNRTPLLLALLAVICLCASVCAAEPSLPLAFDGVASDQKLGSVLFYNFYTSAVAGGNTQNTRIVIRG